MSSKNQTNSHAAVFARLLASSSDEVCADLLASPLGASWYDAGMPFANDHGGLTSRVLRILFRDPPMREQFARLTGYD